MSWGFSSDPVSNFASMRAKPGRVPAAASVKKASTETRLGDEFDGSSRKTPVVGELDRW